MADKSSLTPGLHVKRLQHIRASYEASKQGHAFIGHPSYDEQIAIVDALLAALTAGMEHEPVYQVRHGDQWRDLNRAQYDDHVNLGAEGLRIVYAAPQLPQPVVDADDNFYSWFGREWHDNYQHNQYTTAAKQMLGVMAESAWRAGRSAAMLQGEHRDLSYPVDLQVAEYEKIMQLALPDGWAAVPVEPTEDMVIAGFEAELREEFRNPEAWEAFEAMSGCEQAAHRAKLCWAAMIAAVPE